MDEKPLCRLLKKVVQKNELALVHLCIKKSQVVQLVQQMRLYRRILHYSCCTSIHILLAPVQMHYKNIIT